MASAVPAGTVEAEEQDEITLKYQRLLPNYLLTASSQLSALHFSRLHHSEPDFDRTTDLVRCPRCGHCFASTRVSTSRVGSRGSTSVAVADTLPTPGATITRSCNICNGRTIISTSHGTLGDGRARLQSVRGRLKGQRSPAPSAAPSISVKKRTDSEREAADVQRADAAKATSSRPRLEKTTKPSNSIANPRIVGISKKKSKGLEGLLLKSRAEEAAKAKQSASNLSDFLQSL